MMNPVPAIYRCSCGSTDFTYPNDPPQPGDMATCSACGKQIDIAAEVKRAGEQMLADMLNLPKGSPGR